MSKIARLRAIPRLGAADLMILIPEKMYARKMVEPIGIEPMT